MKIQSDVRLHRFIKCCDRKSDCNSSVYEIEDTTASAIGTTQYAYKILSRIAGLTTEEATGERQERSARPLRNVLLSKRKRGEMYLYAWI